MHLARNENLFVPVFWSIWLCISAQHLNWVRFLDKRIIHNHFLWVHLPLAKLHHCVSLWLIILDLLLLGLQRRRLIPALTLDSASSPTHRSSKQATSSSSSSSSPGACWVDGPLGPPASSNLRGTGATAETFEIKVYEIDDVERLQKRKDKKGNKVRLSSCREETEDKWQIWQWWC